VYHINTASMLLTVSESVAIVAAAGWLFSHVVSMFARPRQACCCWLRRSRIRLKSCLSYLYLCTYILVRHFAFVLVCICSQR